MKKSYFILPFFIQSTLWYLLTKPLLKFFAHFEVHGYENIQKCKEPLIFAPNHSHELDAVILPLAFPMWSKFAPIFFTSREPRFYQNPEIFGIRRFFYGGWFFKILGAFPVTSGEKNYNTALKTHVSILKDGGSLCIFPEGKFTKTGEIQKAHGGVIHLAKESNASIVPVLITGTFQLTFSDFFKKKKNIAIHFMKPLSVSELSTNEEPEKYGEGAEKVLTILRKKQEIISTM